MGIGLTGYLPYIVYMSFFIVIFLTIFYKVEIGIFFLVPLIPLESLRVKMYDLTFGKDFVDIIIASLIIGWILRKKERFLENSTLNFYVFSLIIITFLSLFIGIKGISKPYLVVWKNFVLMPVLFLIVVNNIRDEKQIRTLIFLMALSMLLNDIYFRTTFEGIKQYHFSYRGRTTSFINFGPNELASFTVQGTMLFLGMLLTSKHKWRRLIFGIIIFANLYVVLYSYSRAAYLALVVSCFFLGVVKDRKILVILGLLFVTWTTLLPQSVIDRINMTTNEEGEFENSSATRLEIWKEGISLIKTNPLGVGFNYFKALGLVEEGGKDAHNMYLKSLVELGVQGFLIYILLYIQAIRSGLRLYKHSNVDNDFLKGLGLGFAACTIANMVVSFFGQDWAILEVTAFYWVFMALVVRGSLMTQQPVKISPISL